MGEALRAARRRKKMSLQEVEGLSDQEFKASVLGAYERGERAISVPRLWRLAGFYGLATTQLLPPDGSAFSADRGSGSADPALGDLVEKLDLSGSEVQTLKRVLSSIAAALEAEPERSQDESDQGSR
ncbi:MAG: helix-turn-helix transcriptional regulator [Acidimicrobiaceae bacterium]|nr:helix-turn-helix transcriptional regulator [Acidimicrobiaceae bacterium]MDE0606575.1 helix-turn-helix transcriptional regulator [Acidimicrobiaceae bacterium]